MYQLGSAQNVPNIQPESLIFGEGQLVKLTNGMWGGGDQMGSAAVHCTPTLCIYKYRYQILEKPTLKFAMRTKNFRKSHCQLLESLAESTELFIFITNKKFVSFFCRWRWRDSEPVPLSSTGRNLYPVAVSQVGCIVTKTIVKVCC